METITLFEQLISHLSNRGTRKRVAVVCAYDSSTQYAVGRALEEGFIDAILVGDKSQTTSYTLFEEHAAHVSYVDVATAEAAAHEAVRLVREGKADILMKGLVNTDTLLHAVLNKETGMRYRRNILEKGSSDDLMKLYRQFRGRDPKTEAMLRNRGLIN